MGMNYDEVVGDEGRGKRERKGKHMTEAAGGWYYFAIVTVTPSPSLFSFALLSPFLSPSFSSPHFLSLCPVKRNLALNGNRGSSDHAGLLLQGPFLSSLSPQQSSTYLPGIQWDLENEVEEEGEQWRCSGLSGWGELKKKSQWMREITPSKRSALWFEQCSDSQNLPILIL